MDDPWAAPAWSTPAKPSSSSPRLPKSILSSPPRAPASFDVSDPWGAPAATDQSANVPTMVYTNDHISDGRPSVAPETPGWGHEASWGSGEVPAPRPPDPQSPSPDQGLSHLAHDHETPSWGGESHEFPSYPAPRRSLEDTEPAPHHTPNKSFAGVPNLASPRSPLSHHSPHSHRSMTPVISHPVDDEEDPEAAFAAALPRSTSVNDLPKFDMPKSPSFGEGDFGGFSSGLGDPWGGGEKVAWGGEGTAEVSFDRDEEDNQGNDGGDDGWGNVRSPRVDQAPQVVGMEQDWEAAQKKIQLQESLVPHDKVERIKTGWKEVAGAVIGLRKLPEPSQDDVRALEASLRKLEMDRDETLRSLATIPININTYPPILSSFTTHTTYLSSLSRPNPSSATSFLNTSAKRPRRAESTDEQNRSTTWLSRSRLGEPEVAVGDAAPAEQEAKSRWAFWGRKPTVERQYTTSGGGVLEVKSATPPPTAGSTAGELKKSTSQHFPPISATPATGRSSLSQQSPSSSRPASVFEIPTPIDTTLPQVASPLSTTHTAPSQPVAPAMAPAPSAVSRFFGRLRRNPSSGPNPETDPSADEVNARDLELGEDDFSFLDQVPTLAPPPPDLLDHHTKPRHEMASLEHMIASRPTALPAPLAPPPNGMGSRSASSAGKRNDMDLLSGLYDDGDEYASGAGVNARKTAESDPIGWDDVLGPTPAAPTKIAISTNPASFLSPPAALSQPQSQTAISSDFDDFGTPQKATPSFSTSSSGQFDDFGDFSVFDSTPSPPAPPPLPRTTSRPLNPTPSLSAAGPSQRIPFLLTPAQPQPSVQSYTSPLPLASGNGPRLTPSIQTHRPRPSLDHTPTLNLVNDASTTKGKRWPAPPSPDMPDIMPPPPPARSNNAFGGGGGFPFLSPPPPPRPGSRAGVQMRDILGGDMEIMTTSSVTTSGSQAPAYGDVPQGMQQQLMSPVSVTRSSMMPTPPRVATPASREVVPPAGLGIGQSKGNGGLSAQDLSFFDNL